VWPPCACQNPRSCEEMKVANGERQSKIAGHGAGVIEEARAD
jgi:hypothetical protein